MTRIHPAIAAGKLAVITGGASGIGLAVAHALAGHGMRLCLVDRDAARLEASAAELVGAETFVIDVSEKSQVENLASEIGSRFGAVSVLMNNAGVGRGGDALSHPEGWTRVLGVNFLGVLHGVQSFVPKMAESGEPGLVINTGSKQGITQPPGDTAYNVSKAAVRALTEGLAHTLRNRPGCKVSAHLLVPGFTYTGMTQTRLAEKPPGAWTPAEVADRLLQGVAAGDFYILCQDNETTLEMDQKRILWGAMDLIHNRPALSRWHPDWKDAFEKFMDPSLPLND